MPSWEGRGNDCCPDPFSLSTPRSCRPDAKPAGGSHGPASRTGPLYAQGLHPASRLALWPRSGALQPITALYEELMEHSRRSPLGAPYGGVVVSCSCCGMGIQDTLANNLDFETRSSDQGFGHCAACFGPGGSAEQMFFRPRIAQLHKMLAPENRAKLNAMSWTQKCAVVGNLIKKGVMT